MQDFRVSSVNGLLLIGKLMAMIIFFGAFLWILGDILSQSLPLMSWEYLFEQPLNAGRDGGIRPIILSSLYILFICLLIVIPIALLAGLFFSSQLYQLHPFFKSLYVAVDILAGVPSIIFGLFGNAFFCKYLNLGYSILAGGLTLACMIMPLSIKLIEASFRSIPQSYISGGEALGLSYWTIFTKIMIPAIMPQFTGAIILSLGRALAETAALLFTSGYVLRDPQSIFDSGRTLSVHIYDMAMNVTGANEAAYKTAFVLVMLISIINISAHFLSSRWSRFSHGN